MALFGRSDSMGTAVLPSELLKTRLERFSRALRGIDTADTSALHRTRVASRRLRELIPVLQLPSQTGKKLSRRLRKVTKRLGAVRELDVMLTAIDELHAAYPRLDHALRRVRAAVVQARADARERLADRLSAEDLQRLARKLERVRADLHRAETSGSTARVPDRRRATSWATDARTTRRAERLSSAIAAAGAVYLPERLHEVRLGIKKLRYVLELASELAGEGRTPALRVLRREQDLLGRMHDLEMLIDRVRDLQASLTPPSLPAWRDLDAVVLTLEDMCRRLHARYVHRREGLQAIAARYAAQVPPGSRTVRQAG
jgi:CHAD domain-containing protein